MRHSVLAAVFASLIAGAPATRAACAKPKQTLELGPAEIEKFFSSRPWQVVTFLGYSGAEYEDPNAMLKQAGAVLDKFEPGKTVVNIGATEQGIGALYAEAKRRGFATSGIVSSQAKKEKVPIAGCVDYVFYVPDETWGGLKPDKSGLSPTSSAIVASSDVVVAIGGGDIARDEFLAAKQQGKDARFIPADMSHKLARDKAKSRGQPEPTDFRGTAHAAIQMK
jgi:hypothetical protein